MPLETAVVHGCAERVERLLEAGARIDLLSRYCFDDLTAAKNGTYPNELAEFPI